MQSPFRNKKRNLQNASQAFSSPYYEHPQTDTEAEIRDLVDAIVSNSLTITEDYND